MRLYTGAWTTGQQPKPQRKPLTLPQQHHPPIAPGLRINLGSSCSTHAGIFNWLDFVQVTTAAKISRDLLSGADPVKSTPWFYKSQSAGDRNPSPQVLYWAISWPHFVFRDSILCTLLHLFPECWDCRHAQTPCMFVSTCPWYWATFTSTHL